MSDGFDEARRERNALERLIEKIPGFRGYQDRELRRDVDRMQREHLATETEALKTAVRRRISRYTDAGRIQELAALDRLERRLDGLSQRFRFTDYGHSGLFDVVKIGEEELARLYEFDLSFGEELASLAAQLEALPEPHQADGLAGALATTFERLEAIEERWSERDLVVSQIVQRSTTEGGET